MTSNDAKGIAAKPRHSRPNGINGFAMLRFSAVCPVDGLRVRSPRLLTLAA